MSRGMAALCAALVGCAPTVPYRSACEPLWRHVHDGAVDYDAARGDPFLPRCRAALAATDPGRLPAAERIAFWVNAYNLVTMSLLAAEPDRWSPRQDNRALFADTSVCVGRARRTLDQLEHVEIARLTRDPRIEFLLSCGTRGCALLPRELVTGENLRRLTDDGERRFLARRWNLEVDPAAGVVYTSQLFAPDWHGADFSRAGMRVESLLARHLDRAHAEALLAGRLRLVFRAYDWRTNRIPAGYAVP